MARLGFLTPSTGRRNPISHRLGQRLDDASHALLEAEKQKTDLASTTERLKAERNALTKSNTDIKALARQAEEQERRLNVATNALANVDARRKQLEVDASAAQTRFEQIQKEADELRQAREKLSTDLAALRQQIQALKDELALFDEKAADFKALQTATHQEEQKLAKLQQQSATAEARASEMESRLSKARVRIGTVDEIAWNRPATMALAAELLAESTGQGRVAKGRRRPRGGPNTDTGIFGQAGRTCPAKPRV